MTAIPKIVTSTAMVEQFRFPRSKRRRIRAKWEKRPRNFRPMRAAFFYEAGNVIYCHPQFAAALAEGRIMPLHKR
jgi:hypothetical protein